MTKDALNSGAEMFELDDEQLEGIAGGGKGGKRGCCPGCGSKDFIDLGGGKIKCRSCGWEGTRTEIGA